VVSKQDKLFTFEEETEMAEGGVSSEQLSVEGGVLALGGGQLLGVES